MSSSMEKKEDLNFSDRILAVDYLKFLGIIGVLGIHVSSFSFQQDLINSAPWFQGLAMGSLSRFGIILFVMASGFLLLRKERDISYIPSRIKRVVIPFIFWLVIGIIAKVCVLGVLGSNWTIWNFLSFFGQSILDPTIVSVQFWYVYMIIGLYLFSPIISTWIHKVNIKEIEYFLMIWLFTMLISFFGVKFLLNDYLIYFSGLIGYFILGYYLSVKKSEILKSRKFGLALFIIGSLMAFFGTVIISSTTGELSFYFMKLGDLTPNAFLQAVGIFIILFNTDFNNVFGKYSNFINHIVVKVAIASYGVYLSNILLIRSFDFLSYQFLNDYLLIYLIVFLIFILAIDTILITIMGKIPILKRFSGIQ